MRRLKQLGKWLAANVAVGAACSALFLYGFIHEKQYQEEIQQQRSAKP